MYNTKTYPFHFAGMPAPARTPLNIVHAPQFFTFLSSLSFSIQRVYYTGEFSSLLPYVKTY